MCNSGFLSDQDKTILGPLYLPHFFGVHPVDSWKQDKSQVAGASATNVRAAFEIRALTFGIRHHF